MKKLLLLLLLSLPLNAQWSNSVFVSVGDNSGLGYTYPTYNIGAEIVYNLDKTRLTFDGDWSPNRKSSEEYGWSSTSHLMATYDLEPVFVGGCVGYSFTKAPLWYKNSFRPCVVLGVELPIGKDLLLNVNGRYIFKGTDTINELTGMEFHTRVTYNPYKLYLTLNGNAYTFLDSNNHDKSYNRTTYGLTIGKIF